MYMINIQYIYFNNLQCEWGMRDPLPLSYNKNMMVKVNCGLLARAPFNIWEGLVGLERGLAPSTISKGLPSWWGLRMLVGLTSERGHPPPSKRAGGADRNQLLRGAAARPGLWPLYSPPALLVRCYNSSLKLLQFQCKHCSAAIPWKLVEAATIQFWPLHSPVALLVQINVVRSCLDCYNSSHPTRNWCKEARLFEVGTAYKTLN